MLKYVKEKVNHKFVNYQHWQDSYQLKILWLMVGLTLAEKVMEYLDAKMR